MSASVELLHTLQDQNIESFVTFPDEWLMPFLGMLDRASHLMHIPATIEREALGIAVGAQLAGLRSALVMQNAGIGNLLNDWASLALTYGIPIPWIVSDRGSVGEQVDTQLIWHGKLRDVLAAAQIPTQSFESTSHLSELAAFLELGYATAQCHAALFPHAFWAEELAGRNAKPSAREFVAPMISYQRPDSGGLPVQSRATWRRYEAVSCLMEALTDEFLFVTLGAPCNEVFAIQDREKTFYMLGSMGLALPLGIGFSRAISRRGQFKKTVVLDDNGSQLMQLGSMGTLAREHSDTALVIVDNGTYGSTGNQASLTRQYANLESIARAFGIANTTTVATPLALEDRLRTVLSRPGPSVTVVLVQPGAPLTEPVPLSPTEIAHRFRTAVSTSVPDFSVSLAH